ncbi:MAG: AAA family ATPase [bacterium]|nr:AAA family ATPase [bacterium]
MSLSLKVNSAVDKALKGFVQSEAAAEALKLGLASGKNVLFHGVGGYGKSEMTNAVLAKALATDIRVWKSQLHVESTISSLYGGIDMKSLRESGEEKYRVKWSLLTADVAVLEEMLDAPASVLGSLKTLFTEGALLNGGQRVESQCKLAIALTNRSPDEISQMGRSEAATLERFPIQLEVTWKQDNASERLKLYQAVHNGSDANNGEVAERLTRRDLADLPRLVKQVRLTEDYLRKKAAFSVELKKLHDISPRLDIWADQLAQAAAFLAGRSEVILDDLKVMRYLVADEAGKVAKFDDIFFEVVDFSRKMDDDVQFLNSIEMDFDTAKNWYKKEAKGNIAAVVTMAKEAKATKAKLQGRSVLEQNKDRRQQLLDSLEKLSNNMLLSLAN